jgi:hypothetical protein
MLIGGMQLVAHKVLLKMALVRKLLVIGTFIPLLKHIFFFLLSSYKWMLFSYCHSVSLNSVIAVLDADFHALPSMQHRQQHCPVSSFFQPDVCLLDYFN